jgi:hypothetical protein
MMRMFNSFVSVYSIFIAVLIVNLFLCVVLCFSFSAIVEILGFYPPLAPPRRGIPHICNSPKIEAFVLLCYTLYPLIPVLPLLPKLLAVPWEIHFVLFPLRFPIGKACHWQVVCLRIRINFRAPIFCGHLYQNLWLWL